MGMRQATIEDAAAVRELLMAEPGVWQACWRDDALERALANAAGLAFVWEEDRAILGFICGHDVGFRGYISELIVTKEARGRGVGRQLVEHIERALSDAGCAVVIADVWEGAEAFYRKLGWGSPHATLLSRKLR